MKTKLLTEGQEKTYAVIFDAGDEVMEGLRSFAKEKGLDAAHFTALGAFERATLGYFNLDTQDYDRIPIDEQVEVLSLVGDVSLKGGQPQIHAHVVVGKRDGTAHGGHILEAYVRPTLEVILSETPAHLKRRMVEKFGLALIDLDAG